MQQAVLGSVVVEFWVDGVVVVEPVQHGLPREGQRSTRVDVQPLGESFIEFEDVFGESKGLRVKSLAGYVIVTDGVVGRNGGDRRSIGSDPSIGHLSNTQVSARAFAHLHLSTVVILQQQFSQTSHIAVYFLHHFLGLTVGKHKVILENYCLVGKGKAFLLVLETVYGCDRPEAQVFFVAETVGWV